MVRSLMTYALLALILAAKTSHAQTPPSEAEIARFTGLHAAVQRQHRVSLKELLVNGLDPNVRDPAGRTPLHLAAFLGDVEAMNILVKGGADPNALDGRKYDIVTILAVRNDLAGLKAALALGASAKNVTSPYDGTALIAAAHLGHAEIVQELIKAGAPLDHVNNLGWTAVIEAIVLGDGGERHYRTLENLLAAGANPNLPDRRGLSPLALARSMNHARQAELIRQYGGR